MSSQSVSHSGLVCAFLPPFLVVGWLLTAMIGCTEPTATPQPAGGISADEASVAPQPRSAGAVLPVAGPTAEETPVAAPAGETWARFRGPGGQGTSNAPSLPTQWSTTENIAWKQPLPGPGASSPIVYGDHIYLTCWSGYFIPDSPGGSLDDLKRHLVALRRDNGQIVWDKAIKAKLPEEPRIRDHGYAANTPAADADRVYVFFGKTGVFAFDHGGNQLWQADVGSNAHGWGTSASPVLHGDLLFINASVESESLIALDKKTGEEKWRKGGIREAWNTPVVVTTTDGREELVVATQGKIKAFDPATGDELWNCDTDIGWYMVPSVVAAEGVVYCLGGRSGTASLAVRTGGRGDVTDTHRLWTSKNGSNVSSPVVLDGRLYWMHDSRGIAYCADCKTGAVLYEKRLERADQCYASALLAGGNLYYVARNGRTFVVAAKPEFEQVAMNDLSDRSTFNGSPAVDGNRLLIRSDKFLYCIGK